jgi:hypothetical protein
MKRSMTAWPGRFGVTAATVAAVMTVTAAPALADDDGNVSIAHESGTFTFFDDGDVFKVCDTQTDGVGVVGKILHKGVIGGDWEVLNEVDDGGDAGCDKKPVNVELIGNYQLRLYSFGLEVARSRVFNE